MFYKDTLLTELNDRFKRKLNSMDADDIEDLRLRLQGSKHTKFTGKSFTCGFGDSTYKWLLICNADKKRAKIKVVGQPDTDPFTLVEDLDRLATTVLDHHLEHLFVRTKK